jgi:uncharacterized protein (TIGR03435 family)
MDVSQLQPGPNLRGLTVPDHRRMPDHRRRSVVSRARQIGTLGEMTFRRRASALRAGIKFKWSWRTWLKAPIMVALAVGAATAQDQPPQAPRAYDVCSVKPSSGQQNSTFRRDPGGGFTAIEIPAVGLVTSAFDVGVFQIFGLPAWATSDPYDVACKDTGPADAKEQNQQRMRSGIEALLADRFHLQYHRDTKRLTVATLRVSERGLKVAPSKSSANPNGGYGLRFLKAEAWSMADLARAIQSLARERVIDKTGLAGRYDFDLTWTPEDGLPDVPLLANVLNDRLGLTITRSAESTEVIVIDHLEKPGGN